MKPATQAATLFAVNIATLICLLSIAFMGTFNVSYSRIVLRLVELAPGVAIFSVGVSLLVQGVRKRFLYALGTSFLIMVFGLFVAIECLGRNARVWIIGIVMAIVSLIASFALMSLFVVMSRAARHVRRGTNDRVSGGGNANGPMPPSA